ncbi:MAG: hypothetical protein Q4A64_05310 [Porphyromonadaceae bacterium]|nr:hypothetical protein [Porphyromonadaceae bacterium]
MASKRRLKKDVVALATALFDEALLFRAFASDEQVNELEALMDDIMVWTDDTIRRIARPDGKDNPKLVRAYYTKLRRDINSTVEKFDERLVKVLESL